MRNTRALAIGVVGVAAALLVGSAVAVAGSAPAKSKGLVRAVHAEVSLIKADGSKDAFVVDRGTVSAVSQSSITLARKDGKSVTRGLSTETKVLGNIQVDKGAVVFSRVGAAFAVLAPRREHAAPLRLRGGLALAIAKARHDRGLMGAVHVDVKLISEDGSTDAFSFDRGNVKAASPTSITIARADGQTLTKTISADTKLRGKVAVGGKAAVISKGSAAIAILARAPQA